MQSRPAPAPVGPTLSEPLGEAKEGGAGLASHLDVLPDPSFLIDGAGRIARANAAAARAIPAAEPGTPFAQLWDARARPIALATLGIAAREIGRFDAALEGSAATFDVALSPAGEGGTVLAVCRDVTGLAAPAPAPAPAVASAPEPPAPEPVEAAPEDPTEPGGTSEPGGMSEEAFREIDHRLRNLFAMVPSLVKLSMRKGGNPNAVHKAITGRVAALSRANSLSLQRSGMNEGVSLDALIAVVLDRGEADGRIVSSGPPVRLATRAYNAVALTIHELATNALAHGALSTPEGRLRIAWAVEDEARSGALPEGATGVLRVLWTETGGPRIDGGPARLGFGTSTVDKLIASQNGTIEREWRRHGLGVTIDLPLYDLGEEPSYARQMQPPPPPKSRPQAEAADEGANRGMIGDANGAARSPSAPTPGERRMHEHAAPTAAEHEAALEAQIVSQIDRIIAGTQH